MYLHFHNVLLITTCLTFSSGHPQPKKVSPALQSGEDATLNFLTREIDLTILNIPLTSSGKGIDVLKAATLDNKTLIDFETSKSPAILPSTTVSSIPTTTLEVQIVENKNSSETLLPKKSDFDNFNIFLNNNGNAIEILKAATNSVTDSNATEDVTEDKKVLEVKFNSSNNLNGNSDVTSQILTTTAAATATTTTTTSPTTTITTTTTPTSNNNNKTSIPPNEINLSELINLSLNDGNVLEIGQKIEFKRSNVSSEFEKINAAGKEILKNTSTACGYLAGKRISFANETTLMELPWTALLLYNTNLRYHCGGSLITTKYVLTAAHCVAQEYYELIGVRLGEYDITEPIDCDFDIAGDRICASTVDADVVKIVVHHDYSHLSFKNDIALLRLDKHYNGRSYYPICIPTPQMMYDERIATVAGWGATHKAIRSPILLKADVPIHDISKCREIYSYNVFNDSTEICGSGANEVDVCSGDSGGAIFYRNDDGRRSKYYQLGIISLGVRRCGDKRFLPAVFTKLAGFYKWIENNLEY